MGFVSEFLIEKYVYVASCSSILRFEGELLILRHKFSLKTGHFLRWHYKIRRLVLALQGFILAVSFVDIKRLIPSQESFSNFIAWGTQHLTMTVTESKKLRYHR